MSKFHHKCPNSIIIPCKFRFLDEKIKLEDQKVEFLNTANHTQKMTNLHLCLVLSTAQGDYLKKVQNFSESIFTPKEWFLSKKGPN